MTPEQRESLAHLILDIAIVRAKKDRKQADELTEMACDLAAGWPTALDRLFQ